MPNPPGSPSRAPLTALPARVSIVPDLLCQEIDGETIVLEPVEQRYFGLNETGTRIWKLLHDEAGDIERCCASLLATYEVTEAKLQEDLLELLTQMLAAGIIRVEA